MPFICVYRGFSWYFIHKFTFQSSEMTQLDTKKAFIEFLFWFTAITIMRLILLLIAVLNSTHARAGSVMVILISIVAGDLISALVLTLLNRLLQRILARIQ